MNNSKAFLPVTFIFAMFVASLEAAESRPNILFCISDDQSYAHAGANGDPVVKTPGLIWGHSKTCSYALMKFNTKVEIVLKVIGVSQKKQMKHLHLMVGCELVILV